MVSTTLAPSIYGEDGRVPELYPQPLIGPPSDRARDWHQDERSVDARAREAGAW